MAKQAKVDRTVVRNQSYKRGGIWIRERHNERKNENYSNPDIEPKRFPLNVYFRQNDSTYEHKLTQMLESGEVSTRGLKPDAKIFEEMVFDVSTAYFDRQGGYEYAKQFFEEAFRFAEKEVGSQYILSAVMHADERNKGLSELLGREVYHYHLHVVYLPVVEKEVKWTKRCKDKSLVGTTKEVIHQISHSKKWAFQTVIDEKGEQRRIASYSLLQTRFFNHMKEAGFKDFERGIKGSTSEHLDTVEFKVLQEKQRLNEIQTDAVECEVWLDNIKEKISEVEPVYQEIVDVEQFGKKKRFSNKVELTAEEFEKLTSLAKFGIKAQQTIDNLNSQLNSWKQGYHELKTAFDKLQEKVKPFMEAMKEAPERVMGFLYEVVHKSKESKTAQQLEIQKTKEEKLRPRQSRWQAPIGRTRTWTADRDCR